MTAFSRNDSCLSFSLCTITIIAVINGPDVAPRGRNLTVMSDNLQLKLNTTISTEERDFETWTWWLLWLYRTVFGSEADHERFEIASSVTPTARLRNSSQWLWETAISWCPHPFLLTVPTTQCSTCRVTPGGGEHTRPGPVRNNHGPTEGPTIFRRAARPIRPQGPQYTSRLQSWK